MVRRARFARHILPALFVAALGVMLFPRTAYAYVDPTSGSLVFQIIVAGVLGAALTVRQWWSKATSLVRGVQSGQVHVEKRRRLAAPGPQPGMKGREKTTALALRPPGG
jgi:hypothetical protein